MGRYNFKGENVESLRYQQLDIISEVLEKRGIRAPDVFIEPIGAAGENYAADVKRVAVTENDVTFKMIVKLAPESPIMRQMGNMDVVFKNENLIYSQILPKFRELQTSANVPKKELFRFAECYGLSSEIPHEVLILEDLKEDNYVMLDRFKPLSDDCVKIVLKNFAIYHSLSFVLKHQEPETFSAFASQLQELFSGPMTEREDIVKQFQSMEQGFIAMLSQDKYKTAITGCVSNIIQHTAKVAAADVGSKHSVIIQGDGWTNNILFKIQDDVPVDCALIDYQLAKERSPAYDIMYMLFNSTSYEQRKQNYYQFIDHYHDELDKSLNIYGLKAAAVYPREKLDADLKRYVKLMLSWCIMVSSIIIRKVDEAAELMDAMRNDFEAIGEKIASNQESLPLFRSRVEGIIDSFIEFGLL